MLVVLSLRLEPDQVWLAISTRTRGAYFHPAISSTEPRPFLHLSHWDRSCGCSRYVIHRLWPAVCNLYFLFKHLQEYLADKGKEMHILMCQNRSSWSKTCIKLLMNDFPISQASDYEIQWVIRVTVVVVGIAGTVITFCTNSTLLLWLLGADISYTLIFPQLAAVLFFKPVNGYGAMAGYIVGLTLRIVLGENTIGLPVVLHLPGCTLEEGVYVQKAPVRTICMLCSLMTICIVSWLASCIFNHSLITERWDIFQVKHIAESPNASPVNGTTQNLREEARSDTERYENGHGVALQPMLQTAS